MISQPDLTGKLALDSNGLNSLRAAAKENSPEAIRETAKQFEAMFLNMMLKSMRDATPQEGMFDSDQTRTYTAMLDQQLSQSLASKGMGLADVLIRQLTKSTGAVPAGQQGMDFSGAADSKEDRVSAIPQALIQKMAQDFNAGGSGNQPEHVAAFQQKMIRHAQAASESTGIPAQFMVGQAALESGWGRREIKGADGTNSYNLFGIKATGGWNGKVVETMTTEYINGEKTQRVEKFRAYDSYAESFRDFANMISKNPRYQTVMDNLQQLTGYAQALQKAGYATDPNYADKLIKVVQQTSVA
ncbi:Peptidoglycan hydrolase FlgJ [Methylophilaceae bacterium]|nr:Peptidoglycan hydrolase FlgJ [Methylophilaceae bacterium]